MEKAALREDSLGNFSIREDKVETPSYTDRLYGINPPRGGFRGRGNRGRGRGRGAYRPFQSYAEVAQKVRDDYEAEVTVPQPRGTINAINRQRAVNQLQVAMIVRTLRPQVTHATRSNLIYGKSDTVLLPSESDPSSSQG